MFSRVAVVNRGEPAVRLIRAVRQLNEERGHAVWVGWGFVAEDPAFAELCERLGLDPR